MLRVHTAPKVVLSLILCLFAFGAFGQEVPGVITTFNGTLSGSGQEDPVAFEVDPAQYTLNSGGGVDFVFVMSAEDSAQSPVDPGLISIAANGSGSVKQETRRPDTATSTASIALATLTPGMYEVTLRSEHKTTGAYRLDVFLAGDANGDYKVDAEDLGVIGDLSGTKKDDESYSTAADVDQNGVINGGDRQRAQANLGATAPAPAGEDNPLDISLPPGALQLVGMSPENFNPRTGGLKFSLTGADFETTTPNDFILTINGVRVPASSLVFTPNLLTANVTLANGKNVISFKGYDTVGRPLYLDTTLWAGSASLTVNLVHPNGAAFTQQASVVASLSDDHAVTAQGITTTGTITFTNVPSRTILVKAKGINNEIGTAGIVGGTPSVTIKMTGFNPPSSVDNNDISLGTEGWTIGAGAPVWVVEHKEIIPGFPAASSETALKVQSPSLAATALVDQDLMLGTSGQGERNLSRTFTTEEGTTAVRIRYRFITSEVPGGYFGTQWNDYFRVSLRTQLGGGAESETNSMNGLGLAAFNYATGETNWREITLPVDRAGDTIQADIAVANVGDALFQSQVVVDFVEEIKDQVRPSLAWNNTQGGLRLTWEVLGEEPLQNDVTITVQFANGTGYANRLGSAVFTHVVPAGTAPGNGGPVNVPGGDLSEDPAGTTHIIAWSSETMVGSIADVRVNFGANANQGAVSAGMLDIVKDGLRAAGASTGTITSTARTPADQARAMFQNIQNTGTAEQFRLYGAAGDAVIQRYIDETDGLTAQEIRDQAATIQAEMVEEINEQGPENVSRHCGDPAVRTVVDVSYNSFNANNRGLFRTAVSGRVTRIIDEPRNNCFHLELVN